MTSEKIIESDVLVIGGGMAGIFAAIKAQEEGVNVTIVDKGYVGRSGSTMWTDTFCVFNPEWGHDLKKWMEYIANSGEYMNNPEWTEITLKESYDRYQDLLSWGVKFKTAGSSAPDWAAMGLGAQLKGNAGEHVRRCAFGSGYGGPLETLVFDGYGWEQLPALRRQVLKSGVNIMDRIMITDLMKQDGRVVGAVGFHTGSGDFYIFQSKATVLCSGGGNLWGSAHIEKPLTYEGEAMAYRAGAAISGMELTGRLRVIDSGKPGSDAKESLKGREIKVITPEDWHHGTPGRLVDAEGNEMEWFYHYSNIPAAIVSGRGPIYCDLDPKPGEIRPMLKTGESKEEAGFDLGHAAIDPTKGGLYLGVGRFEFYSLLTVHGGGTGVWSADTKGSTNLPGLFAAGDCYHSGAVGAMYPFTGTGLRNASVIGTRAGRSAAGYASKAGKITLDREELARSRSRVYEPLERDGGFDAEWVEQQMRNIMIPYYISIVKRADRLNSAMSLVDYIKNSICPMMYARPKDAHGLRMVHEIKGGVLMTEIMLKSSLFRTESRGAHYREDYPKRDDPNWLAWVKVYDSKGEMKLEKMPLPKNWVDLSIPYRERYPLKFLGEK